MVTLGCPPGSLCNAYRLKAIRAELIQAPTPDNGMVAIIQATVTTERGTFECLGDAPLS